MALFRRFRAKKKNTPQEAKSRQLMWQLFFGTLTIGVVVGICICVWYLTRLEELTINTVLVSGGETIDHEMIKSRVENELIGSYFLLVPKRFTYTYPRERIVDVLYDIPRVHAVEVTRTDQRTLSVRFKEHIPHALWCDSLEEFASCIFLNKEGYAFAPAPPLRGGAFIRYINDATPPEIGLHVYDHSFLLDIERFIEVLLSELSMRIHAVRFTDEGDVELHIHGGGVLKIAFEHSIQNTFENLQSILGSEEYGHLTPGNFNYIDLRFGNRVFVNEELEDEINATSTSEVPLGDE